MSELEALRTDFPDSVFEAPPCGATVCNFVVRFFRREAPSIKDLGNKLNADPATGEISMAMIGRYLDEIGLHVYPVQNSLQELDGALASYCTILHVKATKVDDPDHFIVAIKKGNAFFAVDPPRIRAMKGDEMNLVEVSNSLGYSGTAILVSDTPVHALDGDAQCPTTGYVLFPIAVLGVIVIMSRYWTWFRTRFQG